MDQNFQQFQGQPPVEKKESEWKNILTIIFLVLSPIVGLILMWLLAEWGRKTKRIVTLALGIPWGVAFLGILAGIALVSLGGSREAARDARRTANVRQISFAAELYWQENGVYPTNLEDMKKNIGDGLKDPQTNLPYTYILQANGQDYVICAKFEAKEKQKANCLNSQGAWVAE
jgi:hypothetical protein